MTDAFPIYDPDAPPAENISAVLAYREEVERERAWEREQAARACERHRSRIARGTPPDTVLRAVERGAAPAWVTDTLRSRFAPALAT